MRKWEQNLPGEVVSLLWRDYTAGHVAYAGFCAEWRSVLDRFVGDGVHNPRPGDRMPEYPGIRASPDAFRAFSEALLQIADRAQNTASGVSDGLRTHADRAVVWNEAVEALTPDPMVGLRFSPKSRSRPRT